VYQTRYTQFDIRNGTLHGAHYSGMTKETGWRVVVRNDDVNTAGAVAYLLHRICGTSLPDVSRAMLRAHAQGWIDVGWFAGQDEAEQLTARLQLYGLHGQMRRAQ
jgi:ATP-dependent Clp protease adapter protein ClpS